MGQVSFAENMKLFIMNRLKINMDKDNAPVLCYNEEKIVGFILPIRKL